LVAQTLPLAFEFYALKGLRLPKPVDVHFFSFDEKKRTKEKSRLPKVFRESQVKIVAPSH